MSLFDVQPVWIVCMERNDTKAHHDQETMKAVFRGDKIALSILAGAQPQSPPFQWANKPKTGTRRERFLDPNRKRPIGLPFRRTDPLLVRQLKGVRGMCGKTGSYPVSLLSMPDRVS